MKINTSQISMDASAEHKDVTGKSIQVGAQIGEGKPKFRLNLLGMPGFQRERFEENHQSQKLHATSTVRGPDGEKKYETNAEFAMEKMVSEVMGTRVRIRNVQGLQNREGVVLTEPINPPGQPAQFTIGVISNRYQSEKISIHSSGSVQLEDGREINFSLDLSMERESMVTESLAWRGAANVLMDPLVFNFDCDLQCLANQSFQFDLDSDGENDETFSLQPGSGFLALDLNNDKQINNGSELFGPSTGQGFQELAVHDLDANGWIDENDPVFAKLRIWSPGKSGDGGLISLAEAGVGAICLTHDKTAFQLRDSDNTLMGEVAASGFFLTEGGDVRPLQEIKLAINGEKQGTIDSVAESEALDSQLFLREVAKIRQVEVQEFVRFQSSQRARRDERTLLERLFPDWQKEKELQQFGLS